ncbi:Ribosomal protein S24E [Thermoplasmatales archaeon BRNA1]|nr:Ribosomal protein S24E [Thermoplasmatales archaeon BRNA1]
MKMEIQEQKENVLQGRTEVHFLVDHDKESTPGRHAVAEELAKKFNTKRELVIIDSLDSMYGVGKTLGYAKIYKDVATAKKFENDYLLKRNGYQDKPAEEAPSE